jgi:SOS-response transcriptional repressor LexA
MNDSKRPSKKQQELLGYIDGFIRHHGYGPSYREVMRALGYRSVSTVAIHINNLIAKGWLTKKGRSARSLGVTLPDNAVERDPGTDWLLAKVEAHFSAHEQDPRPETFDEIRTLTGALAVLGLHKEAEKFKKRLQG